MIRSFLLATTLTLSTLNAYSASPPGFFFFGDSLTDSGYQNNNPTVKSLGKTPQWTSPHGHTWAYYFLQNYNQDFPKTHTQLKPNNVDAAVFFHPIPNHITPVLDGNNFAAGGSTTSGHGILNNKEYKSPSLLNQIDYFVDSYAPNHSIAISQHEYLIWSGGNNLMKQLAITVSVARSLQRIHLSKLAAALHLFDLQKLSKEFHSTQTQIANNLLTAVTTLERAGAKKIIVILLPDVSVTPLIKNLAQGLEPANVTAQLSAAMSVVTDDTNALIRKNLAGTHVKIIEINQVMRPITKMTTPGHFEETAEQFGKQRRFLITNNKGAACRPNQLALTCIPTSTNASHYVFEDSVHPTDQTHQIIGDYVYHQSRIGQKKLPQ